MKKEKEKLCTAVVLTGLAGMTMLSRYRCHENAFLLCTGLKVLGYKTAVIVSGFYRCFTGLPIHHSWVRWKRYIIETDPHQLATHGQYPNDPMAQWIGFPVIDDERVIQRYEIRAVGSSRDEHFDVTVFDEAERLVDILSQWR